MAIMRRVSIDNLGSVYGTRVEKDTFEVAMVINSVKGTVTFIIDGENKGVAFHGDELKDALLFPAVALREGSKVTFINTLSDVKQVSI